MGAADRSKPAALDQQEVDEFASFNVTVEPGRVNIEEERVPIPSDIWASFILFNRLATQWRVNALVLADGSLRFVYFGLDYAAVVAMMEVMKIEDGPALMDDMRVMEAAALPILNGTAHAEVQS